jgi:hypothetical protein
VGLEVPTVGAPRAEWLFAQLALILCSVGDRLLAGGAYLDFDHFWHISGAPFIWGEEGISSLLILS